MYQKFRDDGMFVGSDACFCAFDHPDRGLRSALKLLPIISNGHIVDAQGFVSLLDHVVSRGMKMFGDTSCSQVLFAHKISFSMQELQQVVQTIVEVLQCTKICLINEVSLIPRSISRNTPSAAIVVDIGAYQTSVYPIYEGLIFSSKVQTTNVGSEHVTEYLQLLLYAQNCESYNNLMPRRCKEIARDVKEKTAMVVRYNSSSTL
jgi:actin-related protein